MSSSSIQYSLASLLKTMVEQGGSDLHITVNTPPRIRIDGELVSLDLPPLKHEDISKLIYGVMTEDQKKRFLEDLELDFSFAVKGLARFRGNTFNQRGSFAAVFRSIPHMVKPLSDLNAPPVFGELCKVPRGLILVTGPTGSGKSTTLAAMIREINDNQASHIITMEDPIEFVHEHNKSLINQREIGSDSHSFKRALKSVLRQDPDVVLVGELRDLETISLAITTAETGHLVMGTLHTNSSVSTLTRIIDVFPPDQQAQIRTQLSGNLVAAIAQVLLPKVGGGRVAGYEILIPNAAIRSLIRENKLHQIYSAMQTGQSETGMITLNQHLAVLHERKVISRSTALEYSYDAAELEIMMERRQQQQQQAQKKSA